MLNAAQTTVDEQIFIPAIEVQQGFQKINDLRLTGNGAVGEPAGSLSVMRLMGGNRAPLPTTTQPVTAIRDSALFVTGFTFGRQYQWSRRYTKTVNWCWVGCSSTYYVEPYANLGYGLGLRFPVRVSMELAARDAATAVAKARIDTLDGSTLDYRSVGLANNQLFDGQELVAELQAKAGLRFDLPVVGQKDVSFGKAVDLTQALPQPLKGGNFKPPMPGNPVPIGGPIILNDVDLLFGQADFGVVGANINPAVQLGLSSNRLSVDLIDNVAAAPAARSIANAETVQVGIRNSASDFNLRNPVYSLRFDITPGLNFKVKVDLGVWGREWNEAVWIPQLTVHLPPNGVAFTCHAGTRCDARLQVPVVVQRQVLIPAVGGLKPPVFGN